MLTLAQNAGVAIDAPCNGSGTCGKCRVRLIAGAADAQQNSHLDDEDFEEGWRLACALTVSGDAVLLVPASSSAFRSGIQTADFDTPQEMRLYEKSVAKIFSNGLRRTDFAGGYGVAVDIGTTTVTAALIALQTGEIIAKAGAGNNQIRYGADVINRIIASSKKNGRARLQHAVREETVVPLIEALCESAGIKPAEIVRCVLAGNTTMAHLFVGADAQSIRLEPYEPAFLEHAPMRGDESGLPVARDAEILLAPHVGSYVGGDITAGTLMTRLWARPALSLFIDLGTNGEIVLGNSDFMLCCACSAGPAFEGGEIGCGMRATKGAIQAVGIDADTMVPSLEIIGPPDTPAAGICGSGLIDTVCALFQSGIINARGKFIREGERIRRDAVDGASYVLAYGADGAHSDIVLSEIDIDNFIRAKGAIFSAIRSMLAAVDLEPEAIERVYIAGGIGSGVNIANAIAVGMLPDIPMERYAYIGNSALAGACAMLISEDAAQKVLELKRSMTYLELSAHPGYMEEFVAACFLPHTDLALFPSLKEGECFDR